MSGGGGDEGTSLEFTPTWIVALVCTVIVAISLLVERIIHYGGKVNYKNFLDFCYMLVFIVIYY